MFVYIYMNLGVIKKLPQPKGDLKIKYSLESLYFSSEHPYNQSLNIFMLWTTGSENQASSQIAAQIKTEKEKKTFRI